MSAQSASSTEQIPTRIPGGRQPLKSPDFIPVIGWLDDLGVLLWAAKQVFFTKDV
jgi:hypothetical protein